MEITDAWPDAVDKNMRYDFIDVGEMQPNQTAMRLLGLVSGVKSWGARFENAYELCSR
jgi:hypothetical protein